MNVNNVCIVSKPVIDECEQCMHSESRVIVVCTNSAIFQIYHGENKLIFNEMMMRSALY